MVGFDIWIFTLISLRSSLMISPQSIISRNSGSKMKANDIRRLKEDRIQPLLAGNEDLALAGKASKDTIDFLTRQIRGIETFIEKKLDFKESYKKLVTIPGIGRILGLTIILETGPVDRFEKVGDFASYCRMVSSRWTTMANPKAKGRRTATMIFCLFNSIFKR